MITPQHQPASAASRATALYIRVILALLPLLLSTFGRVSARMRAETAYLHPGYTFQVVVSGTNLACTCRRTASGSYRRVPTSRIARDVEAGSGLPSLDPDAATVDYVISFRSLAWAFDCLCANATLPEALAARAISTRGPNDTGVALTYLFTALLRMFFGWRAAYRRMERYA